MKRYLERSVLLGLVFLLLGTSGCSSEEAAAPSAPGGAVQQEEKAAGPIFRSVKGPEALQILKNNPETVFLDVRTPPERSQMRIEGSKLVPVGDVIRGRLELPAEKPVMLVCAVGGRSYVAGKVLSKMGYREVYNLDGGIEAWRRAGLPVEYGPEKAKKEAN